MPESKRNYYAYRDSLPALITERRRASNAAYDLAHSRDRRAFNVAYYAEHREELQAYDARRNTPERNSWRAMRYRCANLKGYADRVVCDRWDSFDAFLEDVGECPPDPPGWTSTKRYWTLDRINNAGNYEPGNVRWATPKEQRANQ